MKNLLRSHKVFVVIFVFFTIISVGINAIILISKPCFSVYPPDDSINKNSDKTFFHYNGYDYCRLNPYKYDKYIIFGKKQEEPIARALYGEYLKSTIKNYKVYAYENDIEHLFLNADYYVNLIDNTGNIFYRSDIHLPDIKEATSIEFYTARFSEFYEIKEYELIYRENNPQKINEWISKFEIPEDEFGVSFDCTDVYVCAGFDMPLLKYVIGYISIQDVPNHKSVNP